MSTHRLAERLHHLGELERRVLEHIVERRPISRNQNEAFQSQLTLGQRVADKVATFGGSWTFIFLFAGFIFAWTLYNSERIRPFDPYPFILLNLLLSCTAAIQAPVIMMSQNRQEEKDRLDAQHDYEVNLKAELEIVALQTKLDDLQQHHLAAITQALEKQAAVLERIQSLLVSGGRPRDNS